MNNLFLVAMYNSSQPSTGADYLGDMNTFLAVVFAIMAVIFLLWIWSMLAMISLSNDFKDFLYEYRKNEESKRGIDDEELSETYSDEPESSGSTPLISDMKRLKIIIVVGSVLIVLAIVVLALVYT